MSVANLIRNNAPWRKPQLWRRLPVAVSRRLLLEFWRVLGDERTRRIRRVGLAGSAAEMEVDPQDSISRAIFLYGVYEVAETAFVRWALAPGDTFIDVGANSGYFTVLAGELVGPTGRVVAFEPVDELRGQLTRNVELNGFRHVEVRSEAVWREEGEVSFFEADAGANSGVSSILAGPGRAETARVVKATSLDAVCRGGSRPATLIKVDVEGAELDVLAGAAAVLSSPRPPLVVFETREPGRAKDVLGGHGLALRRLVHDLRHGFDLRPWDDPTDDPMDAYEAPAYVAAPEARLEGLLQAARAH